MTPIPKCPFPYREDIEHNHPPLRFTTWWGWVWPGMEPHSSDRKILKSPTQELASSLRKKTFDAIEANESDLDYDCRAQMGGTRLHA